MTHSIDIQAWRKDGERLWTQIQERKLVVIFWNNPWFRFAVPGSVLVLAAVLTWMIWRNYFVSIRPAIRFRPPSPPSPVITVGSISREAAAERFPFLASRYSGRRNAIRDLTHRDPEFVFWIFPDGRLHDARRSHRDNVPKGFEHILRDEPDYCSFLRGRVVRLDGHQLIAVYCRSEALAEIGPPIEQFVRGLEQMPIPIDDEALVVSDNADIYGTVADVSQRRT